MRCARRSGFSLLEVLLATSILIGSTIALLELVTISNRHASSAQNLSKSQLICQSKLNEILAGAAPLEAVRSMPVEEDPQWVYWVELRSPEQEGFVAVEVGAAHEPVPQKQSSRFTLIRWLPDPRANGRDGEKSSPAAAGPNAQIGGAQPLVPAAGRGTP
jgi:hypothetical protein